MRTIKFRGKRLDNGEWVYGELCTPRLFDSKRGYFGEDVPCIFCDEGNVPIIPESVGQFTGLRDKNGKEIYEGDIVRYSEANDEIAIRQVHFIDGAFSPLTEIICMGGAECEVIGNAHDNPELLNEK